MLWSVNTKQSKENKFWNKMSSSKRAKIRSPLEIFAVLGHGRAVAISGETLVVEEKSHWLFLTAYPEATWWGQQKYQIGRANFYPCASSSQQGNLAERIVDHVEKQRGISSVLWCLETNALIKMRLHGEQTLMWSQWPPPPLFMPLSRPISWVHLGPSDLFSTQAIGQN